jgi:copper transport protein
VIRRWLRPAVAVGLVLGGVVGFASPAFAHAQLLGTSPANGAVVASPPRQVVLTFGEAVQAPPTAIEVFGADGRQVVTGPVNHPSGRPDQVEAALPASLHGTYVVSWRVISADTHPVQGAFSFSVGAPSPEGAVGALEQHLLATRHPSRSLGVLTGTLRTLILLAVLVAVGGVVLLLRWPEAMARLDVPALLFTGTGLAAVASLAAALAQGPYDAGRPLGDALRSSVLSPVLHSSFGTGAAVRIGSSLLVLIGLLAGRAAEGRRSPAAAAADGSPRRSGLMPPLWLLTALAGCAGLVVSLSLSGHATTGRWQPLAFVADLVHVGGAATWIGGLIVLAVVLGRAGGRERSDELGPVLSHFSTVAAWAVAVIVASGLFQAWRQVGSWKALSDTDYGKILLLKVTLTIAAVEAGWFSRRWLARRLLRPDRSQGAAVTTARREGPGAATASGHVAPDAGQLPPGKRQGPSAARFRHWLLWEAAIGIGIVALTGALIDAAPPQGERVAAAARAYTSHASVGANVLSVAVYPLVPGSVHVAIQLTNRATEPVDAFQVTAEVSLPSRHIGPITAVRMAVGTAVVVALLGTAAPLQLGILLAVLAGTAIGLGTEDGTP